MTDPVADVVPLLQRLIRNSCVNDGTVGSGHEHRSVETIQGYLGEPGTVVEPAPGRQSVVYRVRGTDPDAPRLLLIPHTDVVPANPERWTHDPFGATIDDGFVWGRGAVDMLDLTAAMTAVFKPYLTGERDPLPGDLVLCAVADEEAAGGLGARHLVEDHWELVATDYVLTEIAYPPVEWGGTIGYPVSVGEKGPYWTVLRSSGVPGHGSTPHAGENALEPLVSALDGLFTTPSPVVIGEEWRRFVDALDLPEDLAAELVDPDLVDRAIERLDHVDRAFASFVHASTRLTVSPNMVRAGVKANVVPDSAEAHVDLRALPGQTRSEVDLHLRKAMGEAGDRLELVPVADHPANSSPAAGPLWEAIVATLERLTGSRRAIPTMMSATTDARFFRPRGVVAYGVGLSDRRVEFGEFLTMFHGDDERVSVDSVHLTTRFLAELLDRWRAETTLG